MIVPGRLGVVVLDQGQPAATERAVASAHDPGLDLCVLVVENGSEAGSSSSRAVDRLRLPGNLGFGGGMNAGIERLCGAGCDRFLLLNNDAVLEPGCLRLLAEASRDPARAAVGPLILADPAGTVESCGVGVDRRWGRVRLLGHGSRPGDEDSLLRVEALSGAVILLSLEAFRRVGPLDEGYFFGFEDLDWCLRARDLGFGLAVARRARARHIGSLTLGRGSPDRIYYAARNHLRFAERRLGKRGLAAALRRGVIVALNLAFALRQREVSRAAAVRAVLEGCADARRHRAGPR